MMRHTAAVFGETHGAQRYAPWSNNGNLLKKTLPWPGTALPNCPVTHLLVTFPAL
jgi:hypothetical protein